MSKLPVHESEAFKALDKRHKAHALEVHGDPDDFLSECPICSEDAAEMTRLYGFPVEVGEAIVALAEFDREPPTTH